MGGLPSLGIILRYLCRTALLFDHRNRADYNLSYVFNVKQAVLGSHCVVLVTQLPPDHVGDDLAVAAFAGDIAGQMRGKRATQVVGRGHAVGKSGFLDAPFDDLVDTLRGQRLADLVTGKQWPARSTFGVQVGAKIVARSAIKSNRAAARLVGLGPLARYVGDPRSVCVDPQVFDHQAGGLGTSDPGADQQRQ